VRFLRPGDIFKCRECGAENRVPDSGSESVGASDTLGAIAESMKHLRPLTARERLIGALWFIAGGLVPFVVGVRFVLGAAEVRITLLGHGLMLIGLVRLRDFCRGKLLYAPLIAVLLGLATDIGALLGWRIPLSFLYSVELLLALLVVHCVAREQGVEDQVRVLMPVSIAAAGIFALLSMLMFLSAPLLNFVSELIMSVFGERSHAVVALGVWLPDFLAAFISTWVVLILLIRLIHVLKRAEGEPSDPHHSD